MPLPLISTPPLTQNARVYPFPVGSDESPRQLAGLQLQPGDDLDEQIERAYRQIFFHAFKVDREPVLESRLRSGQITMRDFVRGLLNSAKFRNDFYRCNSNYQMVDQIVGRVLGRQVHGDRERIALSILIAEQGLSGMVDYLLDSSEYLENFGTDLVPYQRGRVITGHGVAAMRFNQQAPRYGRYWRQAMERRAPAGVGTAWRPSGGNPSWPQPTWLVGAPSPLARRIWQGVVTTGGFALTALVLYTAATMLSTAGAG
jgi:phycobilisome rod-core linker protein